MQNSKYRTYYKDIIRLGLPIMVGQLGIIVVGFVDTMMVGHYSTDALAAAAFVNTVFNLLNMVCMGFSFGLTPLVASLYGRGNTAKAAETFKNGMLLNIVFTILLTIIGMGCYACVDRMGQPPHLIPLIKDYLGTMLASMIFISIFNTFRQFSDGIGRVAVSMWIMLICNVVNIVFNYLLIFGKFGFPEWGLFGAGVSTLGARVLGGVIALALWRRGKNYRIYRDHGSFFKPDRAISSEIFRTSWPVSMQMGLETAFFTIAGVMMGWLGAIALASYQIMVIIGMLGFLIYYSFAASMSIKIGHAAGQHNFRAVRDITRCGVRLVLGIMVGSSLIFYFFGSYLIGLFTLDSAVRAAAVLLIIPMILYQLGDALQIVYSNALRGIAKVKPMSLVAFIAYIIVGLPVTYFLGFSLNLGAVGIYLAFSVGLLIAAALYARFFYKGLPRE